MPTYRQTAAAALALVSAVAAPSSVLAEGDVPTLTLRITEPARVAFDSTALGRATHRVRLVFANGGTTRMQLEPLTFRFRPVREGVLFSCTETQNADDRWPSTLEPGASLTLDRDIA